MTSEPGYDVLIVGGGPAGSSCARQLVRYGRNVGLVDKARFPRDKVCGGWITPQVISSLEIAPEEYASGHVMQPITGFKVGIIGRRMVEINYDAIVSYGIRRREFDNFLLKRSGADVHEDTPVKSLKKTTNGWVINNKIVAKVVVGAGGQFCPVHQWLQQNDSVFATAATHDTVVAAQEVEFLMTAAERQNCRIDPHTPELYFYPDLMGYAWCIRKFNYLNIGVGRIGERHLKQRRERLLKWLISSGQIGGIPKQPFKGHAYRININAPSAIVGDGALLIGDAAGLAEVRSGEGICPAVESGLIAADVLAEAGATFNRTSLQPYVDRLKQRLTTSITGQTSFSPIRRLMGRWLLSNRWFVRRYLMDKWFLNRSRPAHHPSQPLPTR